MEDAECETPQFDCFFQGITAGCADVYTPGVPCQYIDLTDTSLPRGVYSLRVTLDPDNQISEANEGNNSAEVPVVIPSASALGLVF